MIKPDYNKILDSNFIFTENDKIIFNFQNIEDIDFLSVFDITELLFYCCTVFKDISSYELRNIIRNMNFNDASLDLFAVNFFRSLEIVKGISNPGYEYKNNCKGLIELQLYTLKQNFNKNIDKIFSIFENIGISSSTSSLLLASIQEIVDNAFSHNFGLWNNELGPLTACIIQNYPGKKQLCISICDFGVGFLKTLKANYPSLENEQQAIKLALEKKTTSRLPKKGGNGLVFLQKNIFNGLQGRLLIRSSNTLVEVTKMETIEVIDNNLPFDYGANIFFTIKY